MNFWPWTPFYFCCANHADSITFLDNLMYEKLSTNAKNPFQNEYHSSHEKSRFSFSGDVLKTKRASSKNFPSSCNCVGNISSNERILFFVWRQISLALSLAFFWLDQSLKNISPVCTKTRLEVVQFSLLFIRDHRCSEGCSRSWELKSTLYRLRKSVN